MNAPKTYTPKTYKLIARNLCGKAFESFIDLCFDHSDLFSLKNDVHSSDIDQFQNLLDALKSDLVKELTTDYWHGYAGGYYWNGATRIYHFNVYIYATSIHAKKTVLQNYDNLFFHYTKQTFDEAAKAHNRRLEDFCFFKRHAEYNNYEILLGTVTHENMCHLYTNDKTVLDGFKKLADWQETEFFPHGFVSFAI